MNWSVSDITAKVAKIMIKIKVTKFMLIVHLLAKNKNRQAISALTKLNCTRL